MWLIISGEGGGVVSAYSPDLTITFEVSERSRFFPPIHNFIKFNWTERPLNPPIWVVFILSRCSSVFNCLSQCSEELISLLETVFWVLSTSKDGKHRQDSNNVYPAINSDSYFGFTLLYSSLRIQSWYFSLWPWHYVTLSRRIQSRYFSLWPWHYITLL